ncbi:hypothetical protein ACFYOW_16090 [Nocardia sp. NPDC006982]|uniref:hypothetical protein n=1 Tax=Nocardia sp. NPDC006982 TaxID=3364307 RepID=UPI0036A225ED
MVHTERGSDATIVASCCRSPAHRQQACRSGSGRCQWTRSRHDQVGEPFGSGAGFLARGGGALGQQQPDRRVLFDFGDLGVNSGGLLLIWRQGSEMGANVVGDREAEANAFVDDACAQPRQSS